MTMAIAVTVSARTVIAMSRYIDADKMIADLLTVDPQYETMIQWCCDVVKAQPTADVVEVVRCKDCKYWDTERDTCMNWDGLPAYDLKGDEYCSLGERRSE